MMNCKEFVWESFEYLKSRSLLFNANIIKSSSIFFLPSSYEG